MTAEPLFLGLDGGGSGCRARLVDASGRVLGTASAGPANLTTGFEAAIAAIEAAWRGALAEAGLAEDAGRRIHAVMGVAGAAAKGDGARLAALGFPFAALAVVSDSEIACRGAHGGRDGGLLVLGTGSQGVVMRDGRLARVGGWGFALSDGGSGAVLGRAAARRALLASEGVEPGSLFTSAAMARFGDQPAEMLAWALGARPADYAALAPLVFDHADAGDPVALTLRADAVDDAARLLVRMGGLGAERVALAGGLAARYRPLLPDVAGITVVVAEGDALDGAVALARSRFEAAAAATG